MAVELRYKYQLITEAEGIRLIELQPSQDLAAPIQCNLIHINPSVWKTHDIFNYYIAISYVWGNPDKSNIIMVDGRYLGVTSNVNSALQDIRNEIYPLFLWIDAVCINQEDNEEKALQIGLMGEIYAGAQHTIIYLGPADDDSPEVLSLNKLRHGLYDTSDETLGSVLMKEWFTRVWVFQEFVVSTSPWLQCGRTRIFWKLLS